jgi:uncharacterized protein (UPF0335 family)
MLCGLSVFIIFYKENLQKEEKLKQLVNILKTMDTKIDEVARTEIKDIKADIKSIGEDVTALKIAIATLKVKVGYIAGGFSFGGALIFAIVKEFIFK